MVVCIGRRKREDVAARGDGRRSVGVGRRRCATWMVVADDRGSMKTAMAWGVAAGKMAADLVVAVVGRERERE